METATKEEAWQKAVKQVLAIQDKLGMPIDKEITEAVAALRLHGFNTISSCGGHVARNTGGPYVLFESQLALHHAQEARKLVDHKQKYLALRKKAKDASALEINKLLVLLENFYANRQVAYRQQIVVQYMPLSIYSLHIVGAEAMETVYGVYKSATLQLYQKEFADFSEYLKKEFFAK
ncbi:hypothetical protein JNJ66_03595 [Candidatus Saccharibacteria bacterium]|nr:hypothetical protein [Candidatus Saccharibacteria bacterium]